MKHRVPPTIMLTRCSDRTASAWQWCESMTSCVDPILMFGMCSSVLQLVWPILIGKNLGRCSVYVSPGLTLRLSWGAPLLVTLLVWNLQNCTS